jgi:hypothetical protein
MDLCAHCPNPNKPIPCYEMATRKKLHAKALLEEIKMILDWFWNFQLLTISLSHNKLTAWMNSKNCAKRKD